MGPIQKLDEELETELKKNFRFENAAPRRFKVSTNKPHLVATEVGFEKSEIKKSSGRIQFISEVIRSLKESKINSVVEYPDIDQERRFLGYKHYKYLISIDNMVWAKITGY